MDNDEEIANAVILSELENDKDDEESTNKSAKLIDYSK